MDDLSFISVRIDERVCGGSTGITRIRTFSERRYLSIYNYQR